jgi:hypothetical protein
MANDVKVFVQNCLHCVATVPGSKEPRPLGTQLHATKPNEILHFDFLCIGLSRDGKYQYLLLLKDDLSGYLWLVPCRTADAAATVDALIRWFAALSFNISASGVVSACLVKTCIGVLLFSLVDKELFRMLCTMLTTSGHSSAYIFSSDSTARKARLTCLHADSIVPFDHGKFAVVK